MQNYGSNVTILLASGAKVTLHNVTEIHYHYRNRWQYKGVDKEEIWIAFESDIHSTGVTWNIGSIQEFETTLAKEEHENF